MIVLGSLRNAIKGFSHQKFFLVVEFISNYISKIFIHQKPISARTETRYAKEAVWWSGQKGGYNWKGYKWGAGLGKFSVRAGCF